ncbi:abc transporter [Pochonia chlamydosporia 170]|uniref:Abc transporter n=1 Tax=Pochonia chlamydosporia 170 TaxID=1380566 RepID=A0A179EZ86_METCM|nr:abc transporter [Pochonia chlamydosporia 170]OAQ58472.2 abc transporter [Pochonia chlamydosporia 170]
MGTSSIIALLAIILSTLVYLTINSRLILSRNSLLSRFRVLPTVRYLANFKVFLPYLLPRNNRKVQLCLATCLACMIGERFLNVLVPRQIALVADKLSAGETPYGDLAWYILFLLLHGESGLGLVIALCKVPIKQFSHEQLTMAAFCHAIGLSVNFHANENAAEVAIAIGQGDKLVTVVEATVLEVVPTVIDIGVAFAVLNAKYSLSVSVYMVAAAVVFVLLEAVTSSWNVARRRTVAGLARDEKNIILQALQGWATVSIFNMFAHERRRLDNATSTYLDAQAEWARRDAFVKAFRQGLVPAIFFILACLVIRGIHHGRLSPGDFVFLVQYWEYLIWPIKLLAHSYRQLVLQLIEAEQLLDLFKAQPDILDTVGAKLLENVRGFVEFDHVTFSYDDKQLALKDICISAIAGETVALVGATGSGKSSLLKLLMRLYDVQEGRITIDGRDVRDITQSSLRDALAVVPQDPQLFNTSILENIRYAKLTASDEDIFTACRLAAIHDNILALTNGYSTNVGENGMKLSGGEVQRLAIARAFLRDSPILILDEATSAVDTKTEAQIQDALKRLCKTRTTFVVAHRLSTIASADQIIVLDEGAIIEKGTHEWLLGHNGKFADLWNKQMCQMAQANMD